MHEFGHTLMFGHGGRKDDELVYDGSNFTPNYLSVMNYLFQLGGIPHRDPATGALQYLLDYSDDDIRDLREDTGLNEAAGLIHPADTNYYSYYTCTNSSGTIPGSFRINTNRANAPGVIRVMFQMNASQLDWDCNGRISGSPQVNINGAGSNNWDVAGGGKTKLEGHDDWDTIVLPVGCGDYGMTLGFDDADLLDLGSLRDSCPEWDAINENLRGALERDVDLGFPPVIPFYGEACDGVDNDENGQIDEGCSDQDADTVVDELDNCVATYNPGQEDVNNDFVGDACVKEYFARPKREAQDGTAIAAPPQYRISLLTASIAAGAVILLGLLVALLIVHRHHKNLRAQLAGSSGTKMVGTQAAKSKTKNN